MNATIAPAWPTLDEVELVIESWRQAYNDLVVGTLGRLVDPMPGSLLYQPTD